MQVSSSAVRQVEPRLDQLHHPNFLQVEVGANVDQAVEELDKTISGVVGQLCQQGEEHSELRFGDQLLEKSLAVRPHCDLCERLSCVDYESVHL